MPVVVSSLALLLAGCLQLGVRAGAEDRVSRGPDLDRAARPGRGRQDDDHRADRRHRAERPAHGARQAQRARQGARRRRSPRRSATRWSRRSIAYVPEGSVDPPTAHMRFPGTITMPDAAFETTLEYAARSFRLHGFRDIVLLGDHGGYQKSLRARRRAAEPRMGGEPGARARAARVLPRRRRRLCAGAEAARLRDAEIGTHAGLADTSLSLAVDPRWCAPSALHDAARAGAPTACTATRAAPAPSSARSAST